MQVGCSISELNITFRLTRVLFSDMLIKSAIGCMRKKMVVGTPAFNIPVHFPLY